MPESALGRRAKELGVEGGGGGGRADHSDTGGSERVREAVSSGVARHSEPLQAPVNSNEAAWVITRS